MTLQTIRQLYELSTNEEALGLLADVIHFMRTKSIEYPRRSALELPSSFPRIAKLSSSLEPDTVLLHDF